MNSVGKLGVFVLICASYCFGQDPVPEVPEYLSWTSEYALQVGKSMIQKGRVGGLLDFRVKHTERSYNFKLRATWLSPEVIRAAARFCQIKQRLNAEQTIALVHEAEAVRDTVIMVEIDPREGSGVIPLDWQAFLQPKGLPEGDSGAVVGVNNPKLRNVKALAGVAIREYDYDIFWVVFPLINEQGKPLFDDSCREAELLVRIYGKEGRVSWPVPNSIRTLTKEALMPLQ